MELHGTIERNLVSALRSAKRLRGHPVHRDTVEHWKSVLDRAEGELSSGTSSEPEILANLVAELRTEIVVREKHQAGSE
jgi:hypothetical protein